MKHKRLDSCNLCWFSKLRLLWFQEKRNVLSEQSKNSANK